MPLTQPPPAASQPAPPEGPVFLAVDQQLGEGTAHWVAPALSDPVGPLEVREHQDVEEFGAWSGAEGVQACSQAALKLVGPHGRRLRRRTVARVSACLPRHKRTPAHANLSLPVRSTLGCRPGSNAAGWIDEFCGWRTRDGKGTRQPI